MNSSYDFIGAIGSKLNEYIRKKYYALIITLVGA